MAPSAAVYDELSSARSFAGTLPGRARLPQGDPTSSPPPDGYQACWPISAADLGDHAAALVWCSDTERRGRDACHPELPGWAALTRALIACYQGDPRLSATAARRGQADAPAGTVACAKLASQEMRCLAMPGDTAGMEDTRDRAAAAMDQLSPSAARDNWPDVPDGRRRAVRESREIPRRVADGSFHAAGKADGGWRLCRSMKFRDVALTHLGCPVAVQFAASYRARTQALVLGGRVREERVGSGALRPRHGNTRLY